MSQHRNVATTTYVPAQRYVTIRYRLRQNREHLASPSLNNESSKVTDHPLQDVGYLPSYSDAILGDSTAFLPVSLSPKFIKLLIDTPVSSEIRFATRGFTNASPFSRRLQCDCVMPTSAAASLCESPPLASRNATSGCLRVFNIINNPQYNHFAYRCQYPFQLFLIFFVCPRTSHDSKC